MNVFGIQSKYLQTTLGLDGHLNVSVHFSRMQTKLYRIVIIAVEPQRQNMPIMKYTK